MSYDTNVTCSTNKCDRAGESKFSAGESRVSAGESRFRADLMCRDSLSFSWRANDEVNVRHLLVVEHQSVSLEKHIN